MYKAAKNNDKLQKKARGTGWDIVLKVWIQPLSSSNILLTTRFLCINVTQHVISLMLLNICPLRRQVPVQMFNVHDNFIDTPFKGRGSSGTALDNTWPNLQWKKHQKYCFFFKSCADNIEGKFFIKSLGTMSTPLMTSMMERTPSHLLSEPTKSWNKE